MGSISGLGVANSAHSVDHKSDWPFVTLSNFQQRAGNARHLSGALQVSISPLVTQDNLAQWEDFVQDPVNNYWVDAGHDFQQKLGLDDFEYPPNIERSMLHPNRTIEAVHYFDSAGLPHVESTSLAEYLPVWQSSPVLKTRYINENLKTKNIQEHHIIMLSRGEEDDSHSVTSSSSENRSFLAGMIDKNIFQDESAFVGGFDMAPPGSVRHENPATARFATLMSIAARKEGACVDASTIDPPVGESTDIFRFSLKCLPFSTTVEYLGDPMANFCKSSLSWITVYFRFLNDFLLPTRLYGLHTKN